VTDATAAFFEGLRQRDHQPQLGHKSGVVRIDLADDGRTDRWFVMIDDCKVTVSKKNQPADATIGADKAMFDRIASGEANAVAALLRGAISLEGDWNVLLVFQRLFPSPS
jgi:putative sterol carrier protein